MLSVLWSCLAAILDTVSKKSESLFIYTSASLSNLSSLTRGHITLSVLRHIALATCREALATPPP